MPSKAFGPTTTTADTETKIGGADYTMPSSGKVRRIRVCGYNAVAAKAGSAKLVLKSDRQNGPFEYAINLGGGALDTMSETNEIAAPAISLSQGEIISFNITSAEAVTDCIVSFEWS